MMAQRRIYIDEGAGEIRGVVTLGGRPERLVLHRVGQSYPQLGARYAARVIKLERGTGLALLDLGADGQAALRLKPDRAPPVEGQLLNVEISIEPQGGKAAVVRVLGSAQGPLGRSAEPPSLEDRLRAFAPEAEVTRGGQARAVADQAQDEALAIEHALPGGASIAIETTRALTAVDVDLGSGGGRDPKRAARETNLAAISETARLLRLKGMAGLVVIDLVGRGHDGTALTRAVQTAFSPDQPGVIIGPITKFGTLELALPRRLRPVRDLLCDADGRQSAQTRALSLMRAIERAGRADPGGRILARCAPEIAAAAQACIPALAEILGGRFEVVADPTLTREAMLVGAP